MTLRIPRFLHGPSAEVRKAVGRRVTALRRGSSVAELVDDLVDAASDPEALIVLDRQWSLIPADRPQFHVDVLWRQLFDRAVRERSWTLFDRATAEAIAEPWSFAGLVGSQLYRAVRTAARQLAFIDAARTHWPVLRAVGRRYTAGSNAGALLDELARLLHFSLARQGVPNDLLRGALTEARIEELAASLPGHRVREKLAAGDVDGALVLLRGRDDTRTLSLAEHFLAHGLDDRVCDYVGSLGIPDPHGHVAQWLAGRGNQDRVVR